ncbi:MAG: AraD1 family protein [Noviherbaspirillum sp.]
MRLIQFETKLLERRVGVVAHDDTIHAINGVATMRDLAQKAIAAGRTLAEQVHHQGQGERFDYPELLADKGVLAPLDHEDPAHLLVTGTGLTHLGSAATRDKMHQKAKEDEDQMTDSMRMFKWGVEGGKPAVGEAGVQPEWFYKGDGRIVVRPGEAFPVPEFAEDAGEEPEIAGLYLIGPGGKPYRLGFALGNEFSDHVTERKNYLYLAHSKLRYCSFGPELRVGELPTHLSGMSRIRRDGRVIWEKEFLSGESNMCHTLANLEFHHFKYNQFLNEGDVHVHFFGTATLSFADGMKTRENDEFEVDAIEFGMPLVNPIGRRESVFQPGGVQAL